MTIATRARTLGLLILLSGSSLLTLGCGDSQTQEKTTPVNVEEGKKQTNAREQFEKSNPQGKAAKK